jgi:hypothetical protein
VAKQPGDGRGYLPGLAGAAERYVLGDAVRAAGVSGGGVDAGADRSGCHSVDADLVGGEFLGQADGECLDCRLGGGVVDVLVRGTECGCCGGDVDDGAALSSAAYRHDLAGLPGA